MGTGRGVAQGLTRQPAAGPGSLPSSSQTAPAGLRFPAGSGDLEAVSPVLAVHRHHRAVVQVLDQASSHRSPGLTHEVPALGEEVESLPGGGDQPCFAVGMVLESPLAPGGPEHLQWRCQLRCSDSVLPYSNAKPL